jgi:hypothetical protein
VMTVTPVANCPTACRKRRESIIDRLVQTTV